MTTRGENQGSAIQIAFMTDGPVPPELRQDAETMVEKLADMAPRPVIFARVKAQVDTDRDPDERSIVQGTVDVSGALIRAQAAAPTPQQALSLVGRRLDRRISRLAEKRQDRNARPPFTPDGAWRSGDLPSRRPSYYDRPSDEREIVRRKTYTPREKVTIAEAIFDLDVLDYRFFLFTDAADGKPTIVYERDGDVALRKADGGRLPNGDAIDGLPVDETPAPRIPVSEAVERLDVSREPFVFFQDAETGRACVLYRRYDGHYGLIEPRTREA